MDGGRADGAGPAGDHRDQHANEVSGRADPRWSPAGPAWQRQAAAVPDFCVIRVIRVPLNA